MENEFWLIYIIFWVFFKHINLFYYLNLRINLKFMFKNLFFVLFIMAFSSSIIAQSFEENQAQEVTDQMTLALSLTEVEKEKVYKIHLKRFQDVSQIRKQYLDEPELRNAELKKVFNRLYGKLKAALGEEKMRQWATYKQNN